MACCHFHGQAVQVRTLALRSASAEYVHASSPASPFSTPNALHVDRTRSVGCASWAMRLWISISLVRENHDVGEVATKVNSPRGRSRRSRRSARCDVSMYPSDLGRYLKTYGFSDSRRLPPPPKSFVMPLTVPCTSCVLSGNCDSYVGITQSVNTLQSV